MTIAEALAAELQHESATTRKLLERAPEEHFSWKPHAKSMTLGQLASHLAEIPGWAVQTVQMDEFNFNMADFKPWIAKDRAELLQKFDAEVAAGKAALAAAKDESLGVVWRMKVDGQVIIEMPRGAVLRGWILNHSVHHRGQLSVYLRMKDVPLPQVYGPTADEA